MVIAGHPLIAKAFLRWLFNKRDERSTKIELEHHQMNGNVVKVKIGNCLAWLTDDYDEKKREEMAESPIIQSMISDLVEFMETTDDSIDLLDRDTWGSYSFARAEDMIWNSIASQAAHQQRVENLVQTAGHLGKTHVEEARRSARAKIHCIYYRDFNAWAKQFVRAEDELRILKALQNNRPTPQFRQHVEGKMRLTLMSEWIDEQHNKIEAAERELDNELLRTIEEEMSRSNKSSALDNERKQQIFASMALQKRNRHANIRNFIDDADGGREPMLAEIAKRGIKYVFVPNPTKRVSDMSKKE
eukprot:scaffold9965_cov69-Cyclotella_meneghiniana.AAC.23